MLCGWGCASPWSPPFLTCFDVCIVCCRREPLLGSAPLSSGAGPTFDSLAVEEAMQALGLPAPLCDAACEVVADAHGDCVDRSLLPSALAVAGLTPVDALRVYAALAKVRV